jgi:cell division protein FtsL
MLGRLAEHFKEAEHLFHTLNIHQRISDIEDHVQTQSHQAQTAESQVEQLTK